MKKILLLSSLLIGSLTASTYIIKVGEEQTQNIVVEELRDWQPTTSIFTEWQDVRSAYDFSGYLPLISNQESDFIQTETYKQDKERYEQKREYDSIKKEYKDIGDPILIQDTDTRSNTRTINVEAGNWTDSGSLYNCSEWTTIPETITVGETVVQERTCDQDQEKSNNYSYNSSLLETKIFNQTIQINETKNLTIDLEKEEIIDVTFSHLNNNQIINLSSSFDLSRSYIEVVSITTGELCYWPSYPYNSCEYFLQNLSPVVSFNDANSIKIERGSIIGGTYKVVNRRNSTVKLKIKQITGGTVVSGITQIGRNSTINTPVSGTTEGSVLHYTASNGMGYTWNDYPYNKPTHFYPYQSNATLSSYNNIQMNAPYASGNTGDVKSKISWFVITRN